jgi:hypothetical protein
LIFGRWALEKMMWIDRWQMHCLERLLFAYPLHGKGHPKSIGLPANVWQIVSLPEVFLLAGHAGIQPVSWFLGLQA